MRGLEIGRVDGVVDVAHHVDVPEDHHLLHDERETLQRLTLPTAFCPVSSIRPLTDPAQNQYNEKVKDRREQGGVPVTWILLAAGLLLVVLGVWGGPATRRRPEKAERIPREATVQEAWDILTSPVEYDEELIKIPDHQPWFLPGGDRRFQRGLAVGLGAGLMLAVLLAPLIARPKAPASPEPGDNTGVVQGPGQQDPGGWAPDPSFPPNPPPAADPEPDPEPEPDPGNAGEPEPAPSQTVSVTVAMGSSSQDIAGAAEGGRAGQVGGGLPVRRRRAGRGDPAEGRHLRYPDGRIAHRDRQPADAVMIVAARRRHGEEPALPCRGRAGSRVFLPSARRTAAAPWFPWPCTRGPAGESPVR